MLSEGDLVASLNQSDKVRELQDKIASLRAQVSNQNCCHIDICYLSKGKNCLLNPDVFLA